MVGAPGILAAPGNVGAVVVFEQVGGAWNQTQTLSRSEASNWEEFGVTLALDGDTVVIGAPFAPLEGGGAYVFQRIGGSWLEIKKLTGDVTFGSRGSPGFGSEVAIDGDTIIVSAPYDVIAPDSSSTQGSVFVFERDHGGADNWGQVRKLTETNEFSYDFGAGISISGSTVVVGAPSRFSGLNGFINVYERDHGGPNSWARVQTLDDPYWPIGRGFYGAHLALDGDVLIAGRSNSQAASVYERDGSGAFRETAQIESSSGYSGALDVERDSVLIGAWPDDDFQLNSGAIYLFRRNEGGDGNWGNVAKIKPPQPQSSGNFGYSVSLSGSRIIASSPGWQEAATSSYGAAHIFDCNSDCNSETCGNSECDHGETAENCALDCGCAALQGSCGGQAPSGCYCDEACIEQDDCCPDACDKCSRCTSPTIQTTIVSAVLPYARSTEIGGDALTLGQIINTGPETAIQCSLALPPGIPATLTYQALDGSGSPTGEQNAPVNVDSGVAQGFVFTVTPSQTFAAEDIAIVFDCLNSDPAPSYAGVNTFLVSSSSTAPPDLLMVSVSTRVPDDKRVAIPGPNGSQILGVISLNVGAPGTVTISADTGDVSLPITLLLCKVTPSLQCDLPPSPSVSLAMNTGQVETFSLFVTGQGDVPANDLTNRIYIRMKDQAGEVRGATAVAVFTDAQ